MKITDCIYFYLGQQGGIRSWSNSIVIKGDKTILIDPGSNIEYHLADLTWAMAEDEADITKIDEIWLTHGHPDHAEAAEVLSKRYKIKKVKCHYLAGNALGGSGVMSKFLIVFLKEAIRGKKIVKTPPFFGGKVLLRILFSSPKKVFQVILWIMARIMEAIFGKWLPASNLEVFDEEEIIKISPEIKVIFFPGHTPEEIGFWLEGEKALIIGDLINTGFNRGTMPAINNPRGNFNDALSSVKKMSALPIEILIPAHGIPIRGKQIIEMLFRKLITRMERHRELVKKRVEEKPRLKYELDELSGLVLSDLPPRGISNAEKKQYLSAVCDSLGYYDDGNGKNGKSGDNNKNNNKKP